MANKVWFILMIFNFSKWFLPYWQKWEQFIYLFLKYASSNLALNRCFQDLAYIWALSKNALINCLKNLLIGRVIKGEIKVSKRVRVLLLPVLDLFARP